MSEDLPYWAEALFQHAFDLWKPDRILSGVQWSQATYTLQESAVPCFLNRNPSVSQLEMFGRTEQDDIFTIDIVWFGPGQAIDEAWVLVNRTVLPNGENSADYGRLWVTRGGPRVLNDLPDAAFGHVEIVAASTPIVPSGVTV